MNGRQLLNAAPTVKALLEGPDHRRKSMAEEYIGVVLDAIEADDRDPDEWEARELASALGALVSRWYFLSVNCAMRSLKPAEERAEDYGKSAERHALQHLREALQWVSGMADLNR